MMFASKQCRPPTAPYHTIPINELLDSKITLVSNRQNALWPNLGWRPQLYYSAFDTSDIIMMIDGCVEPSKTLESKDPVASWVKSSWFAMSDVKHSQPAFHLWRNNWNYRLDSLDWLSGMIWLILQNYKLLQYYSESHTVVRTVLYASIWNARELAGTKISAVVIRGTSASMWSLLN